MTRKKSKLPKDFVDTLLAGNVDAMKAVFDHHTVNATFGFADMPALAFSICPSELTKWLLANGADLEMRDKGGMTPLLSRCSEGGNIQELLDAGAAITAVDKHGKTALHFAAKSGNTSNISLLLKHGLDVNARCADSTPLEMLLTMAGMSELPDKIAAVKLLLASGATKTPECTQIMDDITQKFVKFHKDSGRANVPQIEAALSELNGIFSAASIESRVMPDTRHNGTDPIKLTGDGLQDRFKMAWNYLVPPMGHAATQQGEAIRIVGRVSDELNGNDGANWDADFEVMVNALPALTRAGSPLAADDQDRLQTACQTVRQDDAQIMTMADLAIRWIDQNPTPIAQGQPDYTR